MTLTPIMWLVLFVPWISAHSVDLVTYLDRRPPTRSVNIVFTDEVGIIKDYNGVFRHNEPTTLYLRTKCSNLDDVWCRATLLHEFVHFLQLHSRKHYNTPCDWEKEAYQLQYLWLQDQGVEMYDRYSPEHLRRLTVTDCLPNAQREQRRQQQ